MWKPDTHLHRTILAIKDAGMKAGVVLNPHTNINVLEDIISDVDMVCIMSVNPGFGGQKFIENTYSKIVNLKALICSAKSKALIEVDGGIDNTNASILLKCGANVLVAGYYIFSSKDPIETINEMKK